MKPLQSIKLVVHAEPAPSIGDLGSRLGRQVAGGAKFEFFFFHEYNFHDNTKM